MIKIGMSGTRNGISKEALTELRKFLSTNEISEAHHGDCIGADHDFHNEAKLYEIQIIIHPHNIDYMRSFCKGGTVRPAKPYLTRNRNIVDETDILLAFPPTKQEIIRSGTWSTIRYAKRKNKKIFIIFPDGEVKKINYLP